MDVDSSYGESRPCRHTSKVTLKDGRSASGLTSIEISAIVSHIAKEKINPDNKWKADEVIQHFREYSKSKPEMGWVVESPEEVLQRLFPKK
jgi:hypothetical protein